MGSCRFAKFYCLCLSVFLLPLFPDHIHASILDERASLLVFLSGVKSDPDGVLLSWASSHVHVCNWTGIICDRMKSHVVQLDVSDSSLEGVISPALGNLSFLQVLDLSSNLFHGQIPAELGSLLKLRQLSLSSNLLEGRIPLEFGSLSQLQYLNLGSNLLEGELPIALFCNGSSSLQYLDLSNNSLSGEIPFEGQCELKNLRFLLLWSNKLVGRFPMGLANSKRLEWLDLESNSLSGELPSDIIDNMPFLQFLYFSYNDFVSHDGNTNLEPFFAALANASNLQELELAGNNLGGELPSNIGDLSRKLKQMHLDDNLIYGSIPPKISNLLNLTLLNLSCNLLNGSITSAFGTMGKLERLYLSNNSLSGPIPSALGDIPHLGLLDLSSNDLSGSIPDSFENLPQLRRLLLNGNRLSGEIPPSLGKCVNMEIMDLAYNQLSGRIPSVVAGLRSLKLYLNLSNNHLTGSIPFELSKMDMVLAIDLSTNNLSGSIPSQIGSCIALECLNLSFNQFEGSLPNTIGQLPYLQEMDVSMNKLAGEIPDSFMASRTLKQLNFSFNNFSGYVLREGAFYALAYDSFMGNHGLCGSITGMPKCKKKKKKKSQKIVLLSVLLTICVAPVLCIYWVRKRNMLNGEEQELEKGERQEIHDAKYPRISHHQLIQATEGFSSSMLIGSGHFGQVYKGTLRDSNTRIAVKVLNARMAREEGGSFKRECQILKRTRHRNLMRIITVCSKPNFKAIVFPLMSNGSLERHLYPKYGIGTRASSHGDVYSFGVLLLEIVTGKRPTDVLFQGSSLHEWVKSHFPSKLEPIIEGAIERLIPRLSHASQHDDKTWKEVILELIELGLMCTQYSPSTRPNMMDIAHEMDRLKQYISNPSCSTKEGLY
ncbi:hypothetical protein V2J09_004255 [Rumex salicifolius]